MQHQSAESRKPWLRFGIGDEESRPDVVNLSTNTSVRFCSVRSHRGMLAAMTGAEVRDDVAEVRMAIDDALPVEARVQLKNPRLNELNVPMETAARRVRPRVSRSADDGAGECSYHRAGICGTAPPDVTCAQTGSSEAWRLRNTSQSWRRVTEQRRPSNATDSMPISVHT